MTAASMDKAVKLAIPGIRYSSGGLPIATMRARTRVRLPAARSCVALGDAGLDGRQPRVGIALQIQMFAESVVGLLKYKSLPRKNR
jgi:hypothetical protein